MRLDGVSKLAFDSVLASCIYNNSKYSIMRLYGSKLRALGKDSRLQQQVHDHDSRLRQRLRQLPQP